MLTADQQRFLLRYGAAASIIASDRGIERAREGLAGYSSATLRYATSTKGIHWAWKGEAEGWFGNGNDWAHTITWAEIRAHRDAQPAHLLQALRDALAASAAEIHRWRDEASEISPNGYATTDPEVRSRLSTADRRHYSADRAHKAHIAEALAAVLPLATDEPADLIEWAAVTA